MPRPNPSTLMDIASREALSPTERINLMLQVIDKDEDRLTRKFTQSQCKLKSLTVNGSHAIGVYAFKIDPFYCNGAGNLHGGAHAAFFDVCTSLILLATATKENLWMNAGVSRVLTVNYLRPAPEGMEVEMECEVVQAGGSLALLKAVLRRAEDGVIVSTCEHTKAAVKVKKVRSKL